MANKKSFEVALLLTASDKASRVIHAATEKAKRDIASMSNLGSKAFAVGRTSGAFGLGIIGGLGLTVKAAEESEIANKRLESTFKTMGEANGDAAKAAEDYANKLQTQIGVEDEEIQMVQSKLATFKKVSDEGARASGVFNRATAAAYDLQAAGFGEASQNAVLLGKALQDPMRGAAALARTGTINKSEIPLIKQIQLTKGLGAAQEYVLKRVEMQVKGQAANTATSTAKMKVQFAEVSETLGKTLLPQVQKTMKSIGDAAAKFNNWAQKNKGLVSTITGVIGKLGLLSLGISAASFVFGGLFKAISGVLWLKKQYIFFTNLSTAADKGSSTAKNILAAKQWLLNTSLYGCPIVWIIAGMIALIAVVYLVVKNWDKISAFFKKLWTDIKKIFSAAWDFIKNIFFKYTPQGLIIANWSKIVAFFATLWVNVKKKFGVFIDFVLYLPKLFFNAGIGIVTGIWNGIKSKATALFDYVKNIGKKIADTFKNVLGIASPSKVFMDYGVNITEGAKKGIQKGAPSLIGASGSLGKSIKPASGPRASGASGGGVTINFAPVINGSGNGQEMAAQLKTLIPQLVREIKETLRREQRLAY